MTTTTTTTTRTVDHAAIAAATEELKAARKLHTAAKKAGDKDAKKVARAAIKAAYRKRDVLLGLRDKPDGKRIEGRMVDVLAPEVLAALGKTKAVATTGGGVDRFRTTEAEKRAQDLGETLGKWDPKRKKFVAAPGLAPEVAEKLGMLHGTQEEQAAQFAAMYAAESGAAAPTPDQTHQEAPGVVGPEMAPVAPSGDITLPGGNAPSVVGQIPVVGENAAEKAPAAATTAPDALAPRVLGHLRSVGKQQTAEEVATALGVPRKKVSDVLTRLFDKGQVSRPNKGSYTIAR